MLQLSWNLIHILLHTQCGIVHLFPQSLLWRKSVEVGICIEEIERCWADREYRQSQGKVFFIFYSDSQYTGESTSIVNGEAYIENRFLFVVK